eukprot:scaffold4157_cov136-Cylindrotheca_fusiformis.AAC.40
MIGTAAFAASPNKTGSRWSILAKASTVFATSCELKASMIRLAAAATCYRGHHANGSSNEAVDVAIQAKNTAAETARKESAAAGSEALHHGDGIEPFSVECLVSAGL